MSSTDLGLPNTYGFVDNLPHADVNALVDALDRLSGGFQSVSVAGTGDITLTDDQAKAPFLKLTGVLTGNRNVLFPVNTRRWLVWNATTGAFSLTAKTAAGAGVVITQGKRALLAGDGTDILTQVTELPGGTLSDTLAIVLGNATHRGLTITGYTAQSADLITLYGPAGEIIGRFDATAVLRLLPVGGSGVTGMVMDSYGTAGPTYFRARRARGTAGSPTAVLNGDTLLDLDALGHDGSAFSAAQAIIRLLALEDYTGGAKGTGWRILCTPIGSTTAARIAQITDRGILLATSGSLNAAAGLQQDATDRGWLPPRMTQAQRDAISSPPAGLLVFNTDTETVNWYNGTAWEGRGEVALTDGATITVDVTAGDTYRVTLGGNRTIAFSGTAAPGKVITLRVKQDGTGTRLLTWPAAVRYGTDVTAITLTTTASKTDYICLKWNATDSKWDVLSVVKGY